MEGSVFTAGALVQWLRDQVGLVATAPELDGLAAQVPDTGGVAIVPAFTGLGAPHWDPAARGAVFGITRGTSRAHLARAALEATALQCLDVLDAMAADAGARAGVLRVDGGMARSDLLVQMQADLLGAPVERPLDVETTARGAALLAGVEAGVWREGEAHRLGGHQRFEPRDVARGQAVARWRQAVAACRAFTAAGPQGSVRSEPAVAR